MSDSESDLHAEALGGPLAGLASRVGALLRSRMGGFSAATRNFTTYRAVLRPPQIRPSSRAELVAGVAKSWDYLTKSGALRTNNPTRLTISTSTEFEWNGYMKATGDNHDASPPVRAFDASNPLTADEWQAIVAETVSQSKRFPPGILYNTTAAIDTGRISARGLKVGENRGFVLLTGTSQYLEYGKTYKSPIDGWTSEFDVQPVGTEEATTITVEDVTGQRGGPVIISLAECLDYLKLRFPLRPNIIIVPAAGGNPDFRPDLGNAEVVMCDNLNSSFFPDQPSVRDNSTVFVPAVKPLGWRDSLMLRLRNSASTASAVKMGVSLLGARPAAVAQTMELNRTAATRVPVGNSEVVVVTEERPIPLNVDDAQANTSAAKADAGTNNIVDPAGTVADPAKENPQDNPFFDGEGPGKLDAAGPPVMPLAETGTAVSVARFGALNGRLAGYLPGVSPAAATNPSQADPQHFVLDGDGLSSLGGDETARLRRAYDAGKSITVLHPASTDVIAAAFSFLHGSAQPCPCADPIEIIDAWTIQRDRNGGFRQTTLAVPMRQVEASAPVATRTLVAAPALGATPAQNAGWERDDSEAGNTHQAGQLMAALRDAETRSLTEDTKPAPAVQARLLGASVDPVDFIKEVQNVCDVFTQSHKVDDQGSPSTYTVTNIAIPVSCLDNDNKLWDYYYLAHQAVFSCGDAPCTMDWYDFNVWTEQSGVTPVVIVSSPQTTEGQTTTTSSTSLTVGGNLGFFGDTATGGMSVSGTWSKSTSYSSPDVLTENKSDASHVMWTYYLSNDISHTTFQPYMQEVFRFDRSPEAKQTNSPFKTLAKIVPHDNHNGIWIEHWFNAPVPPPPQ